MIKVGVIVSTHPSPSCKSKSLEYFFFSQDRLLCKRVHLENLRLVQALNKDPRSKRRALNVSAIPAVVHFKSSYFRPEKTISLLNYLISKNLLQLFQKQKKKGRMHRTEKWVNLLAQPTRHKTMEVSRILRSSSNKAEQLMVKKET